MLAGNKVLLTGLTGRIGAAVAERFAKSCELWGLARFSREGSIEEAKALGVTPVRADYSSGELSEVPKDFDYVLHVAADVSPPSAEAGMAANSDGAAHLMMHCRSAKAFLHVSTTGVYKQHPDPEHLYSESADLGGVFGEQYSPTKLAGEGAVRAAAIILDLPTVICRQNVQYGGPHVNGGLIDRFIDHFVETGEVFLPPQGVMTMGPIHEADICDIVEPSLQIASVPAEIMNWGGDELVEWRQMFEYVAALLGRKPTFIRKAEFDFPSCFPDTSKRMKVAGPCKMKWKEGVRRSLQVRHPTLALRSVSA